MADHGLHRGHYAYTKAGQLEHKLPLLFMLVSNSLLQKFPQIHAALSHNQKQVVTAFDIYATMRAISISM